MAEGTTGRPAPSVVVVGQAARDLVLVVDALPEAGRSTDVRQRLEVLGGKGANQAVALAQLGQDVALVAVLGDDAAGDDALAQARSDRIDVRAVVRRGRTALLVDVVETGGVRRLLEDVPEPSLLREQDVDAAAGLLAGARTVSLQAQQPARVLRRAAAHARDGARLVLDGAPEDTDDGRALLASVDVLRLDAHEAALVAGEPVTEVDQVRRSGERGPALVAVGLPDGGNLVVWADGHLRVPPSPDPVDPTGGGDSFTAALVAALDGGADPARAGRVAARAAASTVAHAGGRPRLTADVLTDP